MNTFSKIGLAFLAGATAGVIAGILLAPDRGSRTRKKIIDGAMDLGDTCKKNVKEGMQKASAFKDRIIKEAEEIIA